MNRHGTEAAGAVLENEGGHSPVQGLAAQAGAEGRALALPMGQEHREGATPELESGDSALNPEECVKRKGAGGKSVQSRKTRQSSGQRDRDAAQSKRPCRARDRQETGGVRGTRSCRERGAHVTGRQGRGSGSASLPDAATALLRMSRSRTDRQRRSAVACAPRPSGSPEEEEEMGPSGASSAQPAEKSDVSEPGREVDGGDPGHWDPQSGSGTDAGVSQPCDQASFAGSTTPAGTCVVLSPAVCQGAPKAAASGQAASTPGPASVLCPAADLVTAGTCPARLFRCVKQQWPLPPVP